MSVPSKRTIKRHIEELRNLIDTSKDPCETRIAYEMEQALRWAILDTTGWGSMVTMAKDGAACLKRELGIV